MNAIMSFHTLVANAILIGWFIGTSLPFRNLAWSNTMS